MAKTIRSGGSKKTVALCTGYFLPHLGGVERYVSKLSEELISRGYRVIIVTSNHTGDLAEKEVVAGVTVYRLPILKLASARYPIPRINSDYRRLRKAVIAEAPDYFILNTRFHLTSLVGARMARALHRPSLLIEHGTSHFTVGNKVLDIAGLVYEHALTAVMKRLVSSYYGVSKACVTWLKHYKITGRGVFYNAIDTRDVSIANNSFFKKYPDKQEVIIAYAGRLIKEKGVLNLVQAFRELVDERPKAKLRLVIAGDGPLLETLRRDYADARIELLGKLNFVDVMSLYGRTDIFVYPSLYPEGLPTSILEAALMDCAIVATPRGGTEEVIPDAAHGRIVDGSVEGLHTALRELAGSPDTRRSIAEKVKRRVSTDFVWHAVVDTVEKELKELGAHDGKS